MKTMLMLIASAIIMTACSLNPFQSESLANSATYHIIAESSQPDKRIDQFEKLADVLTKSADQGLGRDALQLAVDEWLSREDYSSRQKNDIRNIAGIVISGIGEGIQLSDQDKAAVMAAVDGILRAIDQYRADNINGFAGQLLDFFFPSVEAATLSWQPYQDNVRDYDSTGYEILGECTTPGSPVTNKTSAENNSMEMDLMPGDTGECRIAAWRKSDNSQSPPSEAVSYDYPLGIPATPSGLTISFD